MENIPVYYGSGSNYNVKGNAFPLPEPPISPGGEIPSVLVGMPGSFLDSFSRLAISYTLWKQGKFNLWLFKLDPSDQNSIQIFDFNGLPISAENKGYAAAEKMLSGFDIGPQGFFFTIIHSAVVDGPTDTYNYAFALTRVLTVGGIIDVPTWQHEDTGPGESWTVTETGAVFHIDRDQDANDRMFICTFLTLLAGGYTVTSSNPLIPNITGSFNAGQYEGIWISVVPNTHITATITIEFENVGSEVLTRIQPSSNVSLGSYPR